MKHVRPITTAMKALGVFLAKAIGLGTKRKRVAK